MRSFQRHLHPEIREELWQSRDVWVTLNNRSLEAKTFLIIPRNRGEKCKDCNRFETYRARRHRGTQSPPCLHFPFDSRVCHPWGSRTRSFDVEKCKRLCPSFTRCVLSSFRPGNICRDSLFFFLSLLWFLSIVLARIQKNYCRRKTPCSSSMICQPDRERVWNLFLLIRLVKYFVLDP